MTDYPVYPVPNLPHVDPDDWRWNLAVGIARQSQITNAIRTARAVDRPRGQDYTHEPNYLAEEYVTKAYAALCYLHAWCTEWAFRRADW